MLADHELRAAIARDPETGWRTFVVHHTTTLLAAIERCGVHDANEAKQVYRLTCNKLAANDCAALLEWDPSRGELVVWLTVVVRRVMVDWIRARAGRRRLFGNIKQLPRFAQRVFELYYWQRLLPTLIAEQMSAEQRREVTLADVFDALGSIERVLAPRHRSDLLMLAARARPASLDDGTGAMAFVADTPDPKKTLQPCQRDTELERALRSLDPEDAAIVSLRVFEGLSLSEIKHVLRIQEVTHARVQRILAQLRSVLVRG